MSFEATPVFWTSLWVGLGLTPAVAGAFFTLFPNAMRNVYAGNLEESRVKFRLHGVLSVVFGVSIAWFDLPDWTPMEASFILMCIMGGVVYMFFPDAMRRWAVFVSERSKAHLRLGGAGAVALGVGVVWLVLG